MDPFNHTNFTNITNLTSPTSTPAPQNLERFIFSILYIIVSSFGVMGNLAVVIVICRYPELRQNCKYLQAALAVADAVSCYGQLTNAIGALTSPRLIRWVSLILSTPNAAGIMWSTYLTMCISFDRCYAILSPVRYWHMNKIRFCIGCILGGLITIGGCVIGMYSDVDLSEYVTGWGSNSRSPRMSSMINYFHSVAGFITFVTYMITLIAIRIKVSQLAKTPWGQQSNFFTKQVEVTASISYVIGFGLLLFILPSTGALVLLGLGVSASTVSTLRTYIGLMSSLHASVNCIFYVWKEPSMRILLKRDLTCGLAGSEEVEPVHSMQMPVQIAAPRPKLVSRQ